MKFMLNDEEQNICRVFGPVCGTRCDEIVFNHEDIAALVKAGPEQSFAFISERLQCRFVPGNKEHRRKVTR